MNSPKPNQYIPLSTSNLCSNNLFRIKFLTDNFLKIIAQNSSYTSVKYFRM
ncbi:hypothetical protein DDB_G0283641 [Dictyostelium discoideum AX4]|uniref:Uncharacterized protein n=1 Tax=Dictyostelium discoideum TaxID=44689 RepID=Q54QU2_DICDI|nr:hypothetical protein DDB_G0283641 [Dictyostelium discoideum AX4]EAL65587.1 hypothetical protein DDB_G0283641 [Dictyostelium discoideum AX4]|eukprot:XP_638931.1 hypothetical protein DDB_G0283641 [Dictyostelium discoideum AX4]